MTGPEHYRKAESLVAQAAEVVATANRQCASLPTTGDEDGSVSLGWAGVA